MPFKWKNPGKFKPHQILSKIENARTIGSDGKNSFSAFVVEDCVPILHSMLQFPEIASEIEKEGIVWRALSRVKGRLTPDEFIRAANAELDDRLATKESEYVMLTEVSSDFHHLFRKISSFGCEIYFSGNDFPVKYRETRKNIIKAFDAEIEPTPTDYCKVIVKVKAKSSGAAFSKAMRLVDLVRAIICVWCNPRMQITFGRTSYEAINTVVVGGIHTLHHKDGTSATEGYWYEPNFSPKKFHRLEKSEGISKYVRAALRQLNSSNLGKALANSLVMYVRALDLRDHEAAFLRLWSALEIITTPNNADYDKLIKRCCFMFKENEYHKQVLEHLRLYRNASVHAGEESDNARMHCFQLQVYYVTAIRFYIANGWKFSNFDEAFEFLDFPPDIDLLKRKSKSITRAIRYRTPKPRN